MAWTNEFSADYAVPQEIINLEKHGLANDISWGNDICPSFTNDIYTVWVQHPNPAERELDSDKRFYVYDTTDQQNLIWKGDNVDTVISYFMETIVYRAGDAFFASIAAGLPTINTGDFSPEAHKRFLDAVNDSAVQWFKQNC